MIDTNGDDLLTLDQVAELLKVTRAQVLELTRKRSQERSDNPLPVIKFHSKLLRVRRRDFYQWIEKVASQPREVHAETAAKGTRRPFTVDDIDAKVIDKLLAKSRG
jgi:hypothetical protein